MIKLDHICFKGSEPPRARVPEKKQSASGLRRTPSTEPLSPLIAAVLSHAQLRSDGYRRAPLNRRRNACLRALGAECEEDAAAILSRQPTLYPVALNSLLIGVTEFFRDPQVYDYLRDLILPSLCAGRETIRVWSAGCANGAELYSIAILLAEMGALSRSHLLGSDCRAAAIEESRAGIYQQGHLKNVSGNLLSRYFSQEGNEFSLKPLHGGTFSWKLSDLMEHMEQGPWDLILCRNMSIYLEWHAAEALWQRLASVLRPGGILVVGKAERPTLRALKPVGRCLYRRRND